MVRATKTVQADRDLDEIWLYIAMDNIAAADTLLDRIGQRCHLAAKQTMMGRARPELAPNLRSFPVGNYVVFYVPQPDGIAVVRVLHSARDVQSNSFDDGSGNA